MENSIPSVKTELVDIIKNLPSGPGVYFFYNDTNNLIYVGKSINIKKRVQQHFSGKDRKSLKIQMFTARIDYRLMGSELIALLYESDLIKKHQPIYNRSQRRSVYNFGLYLKEINGYKSLFVDKITPRLEEIASFSSMHEAKNALFKITEKYHLCQKINGLYKSQGSCFGFQLKECNGACINKEHIEAYNGRVDSFLEKTNFEKFTKLFEVAGRNEKEMGIVYIENGVYKGFGFCPVNTEPAQKLEYIESFQDNKDVRRILARYLFTV